ncbi:MAG: ADP-ribosylglycohydrolase family protein [Peptococcaceae bacterium]|nr:ADP-ribosylglycohydrolase family protein [Peptococcaceae bacterium]
MLGVAVGDALGVPVEFIPRQELCKKPVKDMTGYGSHNQPPGTWSDDTSLTLCLVESLCEAGYDLIDAGKRFIKWYREGYWTPFGKVFDIGNLTRQAILRLECGIDPVLAGPTVERSNGNGSLMRILPASLYFAGSEDRVMIDAVCKISCLTHGHPRSQLGCILYSLLVQELLKGNSPISAYQDMIKRIQKISEETVLADELTNYIRILDGSLPGLAEKEIRSDGYVVSTLEAAIWCLLNNTDFLGTVLAAVNLGVDSDTTGAVAGGLAGIYYGFSSIPQKWLGKLACIEEIMVLGKRFASVTEKKIF